MNKIIRCATCDEVFFKTPFDCAPEYQASSKPYSPEFQEVKKNDLRDFLRGHRGHLIEYLDLIRGSYVSEKNYLEPINTIYVKATNGRDRFVVKKYREKIDEPLRYELIHGDYWLECTAIEIQSEAIAEELNAHCQTAPLSQTEISAFLKLYRRVCETMNIQDLEEVVQELPFHPLECYYKPDDVSEACLLRKCRSIFTGIKYPQIEDFIKRHFENDIFLLRAKYRIHIVENPKAKNGIFSGPILTESELKTASKKK